ncbi:hypothetical protein ACTFIZ_000625 [Dictyostelium cf. discoideum]
MGNLGGLGGRALNFGGLWVNWSVDSVLGGLSRCRWSIDEFFGYLESVLGGLSRYVIEVLKDGAQLPFGSCQASPPWERGLRHSELQPGAWPSFKGFLSPL